MHEMVLKRIIAPWLRVILFLRVTTIELTLINDTPPTWRASCRYLVSDRTPRATLMVILGRTVSLIVAQWFVPGARERERERKRDRQFSSGLGRFERHNTQLPGVALYVWCVYRWCFLNGEVLIR
jgi:hypothetical protein